MLFCAPFSEFRIDDLKIFHLSTIGIDDEGKMAEDLKLARWTLIGLTAISYIAVFGLAAVVGMKVDYQQIYYFAGYFVVMTVATSAYFSFRKLNKLRALAETLGYGFLLTVPVLISTYLAIYAKKPLADDMLSSWDQSIGFQWRSFITFVDSQPVLAEILGLSYQTFAFQLLIIPVVLIVAGQPLRSYRMLIGYGLICFAASFISIWFPALGTYKIYGVGPTDVQNIDAYFGYFFLDQFNAVRDDPQFVFAFMDTAGILTFPSVHAGVATLCAWSTWSLKSIRYPMLVLNVCMAIAAVSHASHYLVDVLAGVVVALVCVFISCKLTVARTSTSVREMPDAVAA
ncbi:PAP2 family protein [Rhizobiales bacterium RZME27]|uniref:PAP2 family protein n=2 Tax=Endobacterium cereale TaxID=2663029 RepID=A0A6A8AIH7_9HYPH|nr:PAP2 family protein [Endobacterium cereale]